MSEDVVEVVLGDAVEPGAVNILISVKSVIQKIIFANRKASGLPDVPVVADLEEVHVESV